MEVLTNIGFDWQVALANFVGFLIIFWILKKYFFGPIGEVIEKRKRVIDEGVNKAQESENQLLVARQKAIEEIKEARREANEIIAKAKENGDDLIAKARKEAGVKADEILTQAQKDIEKQKDRMERDILDKTASLVSRGIEKILGENIDSNQNKSINKRALKDFQEQSL